MALPFIWQVIAASLLATALLAATAALVLARRIVALARSHEAAEHRLTHLACEVRRLERLVVEATRRTAAIPTPRTAEALVPLISIPDLGRKGDHDAAGLAEKHGDIWALVEAGRTPREIADQIGRPIGEVELIAGLHRQHLAAHPRGRHDD